MKDQSDGLPHYFGQIEMEMEWLVMSRIVVCLTMVAVLAVALLFLPVSFGDHILTMLWLITK